MNDADRKAFEDWTVYSCGAIKDFQFEAWQAACEWRDRQNTLWRNAAIRVGEDLHSVGPNGYYNMSAEEWLNWALNTIYSKPNFAPPAAQINQQLLNALKNLLESALKYKLEPSDLCVEDAQAALAAATQMRGGA